MTATITISTQEHDELIGLAEVAIRMLFDHPNTTFDEKERLIKKTVRLGCSLTFIETLKRDL